MSTVQRSQVANWYNPSRWITGTIVALLVMSWWKRLACIGGTAVVVMGLMSLAGHTVNGWSFHLWGSGNLPMSAAERAPLFTQAWAAQDRAAMMRFILPSDEAKMQAWLAANPVPSSVSGILPAERNVKTISVQKDDMDGAIVKVMVSGAGGANVDPKAGGAYTQKQTWSYSGGHWFFSPDTTPPPAIAQQTIASNTANSQSNVAANVTTDAAPSYSRATDKPPSAPVSSNVVIPSTVPPWARVR